MKQQFAWAIVDDVSGALYMYDGRLPLYWLRKVALMEATERGFTVKGKEPDVRICRVQVKAATPSRPERG